MLLKQAIFMVSIVSTTGNYTMCRVASACKDVICSLRLTSAISCTIRTPQAGWHPFCPDSLNNASLEHPTSTPHHIPFVVGKTLIQRKYRTYSLWEYPKAVCLRSGPLYTFVQQTSWTKRTVHGCQTYKPSLEVIFVSSSQIT